MAEAAQDWSNILRQLGDPELHAPAFTGAKPAATGAPVGAEQRDGGDAVEASVWSETLARVHGAADLLRMRENQLRELERVHRQAMDRAADRVAALEAQLAAEGDRANRAEAAQAKAEQWLQRIHAAVVEQLTF